MFKNYAIRPQFVRTNPKTTASDKEPRTPMTPIELNALVNVNVKNAAILIGAGYGLKKVLDTASEIALIAARTNFK